MYEYLEMVRMRSDADSDLVKDSRARELFNYYHKGFTPLPPAEEVFPSFKKRLRLKKERNYIDNNTEM